MDYGRASRIEKRKALSELNVIDTRSKESQGNVRFSEFPNSKSAFHQAQNGPSHLEAKDNAENQKENFIDLSRVKKEPRVNIHKLEKKKEEEPSTTLESKKDENSNSKRKKVENPENDTWRVADSEPLNDVQDTRMPWEHRRQVGMDNPDETNRQISIILGNMWRDLSDEEKMKYYKEAQALEKLHKETYPSYVYSPNEARMRKQSKAERKQKLKETPPSSKSFLVSEDSTGSPTSSKDAQEKNAETAGDRENKSPNGLNKGPVTSQPSAAFKGNQGCPPPTYFNNLRPFLQSPNPMYPFSPRPMVSDNFHPALWNPWLLWSSAFYCPPPMTNMEEFQRNRQQIRMPHHVIQEKPHPASSTGRKVEAKSQQCQTEDSDDDADFRPLVIDDGRDYEGDKENSK
ncbi:unnamed protein product [Larinioides sclopetarius]|uniref:Sex-determining region Y protein n=1 Tax=Larinioides sclopetarius TaxID=280406 RepID=A0AAV1ZK52_9ARAC